MDLAISSPRSYRLRISIFVISMCLLAVGVLIYLPEKPTYQLATVTRGTINKTLISTGKIHPVNKRLISAKTSGMIEKIVAKSGDMVTPNSVIAVLSNTQLNTELRSAANALALANAQFTVTKLALADELRTIEYTIAELKSAIELQSFKLSGQQSLSLKGIVSTFDLAQTKAEKDQLLLKLNHANETLSALEEGHKAKLSAKLVHISQLKSLVEQKEFEVKNLNITAGMAGILQNIELYLGQVVALNEKLGVVAKLRPLIARVKVVQGAANQIHQDMPVQISTNGIIINGRINLISSNANNGYVNINVSLQGPLPDSIKTDATVQADIEIFNDNNALYIPRAAYLKQGNNKIYKVNSQTEAQLIDIKLGVTDGQKIQVLSGLTQGDRILIIDPKSFKYLPNINF